MVKTTEKKITESEVVLLCQYGVLNPDTIISGLKVLLPAEEAAETQSKTQAVQILKINEVCSLLNVSASTVRRLSKEGKLRKLKISSKRVGWKSESVKNYIENLKVS